MRGRTARRPALIRGSHASPGRQEKRKPDTHWEYRASLTRKVLGDLYEQQLPCGQPVDCLQDATSMAGIKDNFHRSPPFYYREPLRSL